MEKTLEERIHETKELIKQIISEEHLSPSVVELILYGLYLETKNLSELHLRSIISARDQLKDEQTEE